MPILQRRSAVPTTSRMRLAVGVAEVGAPRYRPSSGRRAACKGTRRAAAVTQALKLLLACPSPGFAASDHEPIRIEYHAELGARCPTSKEFEAQVFARTTAARAAREGERARSFIVDLRRTAAGVAGSLVVQEQAGVSMARRVNGSECADVATVLAIATALAIDPRAALVPREEPKSEPVREPTPRAPREQAVPVATVPARGVTWSPRWALGASAALAAAPTLALGAAALVSWRHDASSAVREFGLEFAYRQAGSPSIRDAEAKFYFYVARPGICLSGVNIGPSFSALPCVTFEAGGVTAAASAIPNSAARTRFWAAAELALRLEFAIGADWFVLLDAGLTSPLTRYRFVFENPEISVHDVPTFTASSALRVGARF